MLLISKREFIGQLSGLLRNANLDVRKLQLSDDGNYVDLIYTNGYRKAVCIEADSFGAIIRDVTRAAMY